MKKNLAFYRYLYWNMKNVTMEEYERVSAEYTKKCKTSSSIHNDRRFHYFIFYLNDIVEVDSGIYRNMLERHLKLIHRKDLIKSIDSNFEEVASEIVLDMYTSSIKREGRDLTYFENVLSSQIIEIKTDDEKRIDRWNTYIDLEGRAIKVPRGYSILTIRPMFNCGIYGLSSGSSYYNYFLVVDTKNMKIIYADQYLDIENVLFSSEKTLKRYLIFANTKGVKM